jgi:predicted metalloprotease with PDZ domain
MKNIILAFLLGFVNLSVSAQHQYEIDLNKIDKDILPVKMTLSKAPKSDQITYSFPATVPGTYDRQDFGRFVLSMTATTAEGKTLKVTKQGNNSFVISDAKTLKYLSYNVEDILDKKVKKNPIFSPVATNFVEGKNFIFNNGGIFGFFDGEEADPIEIKITKPTGLYAATSLPLRDGNETQQTFLAKSYHQLIDCPMMFSEPDTAQFYVGKTKVTISVYDVKGVKRAKQFYEILKRDMQAIDDFLPDLPVDNYTFLVYIDDLNELGDLFNEEISVFAKLKLALKFRNLGFGALEHGNSSTYYLADFGPNIPEVLKKEISLEKQLSGAAIHEFMHILTPLGLHSERIGSFNYMNPVMSKHLWLYEGVTEYFANLIKYKGGVVTSEEYLKEMGGKLSKGLDFPVNEMSFTEMSENVLEDKFHKQYDQVYQRGAVLAMLLDAEIQRLTLGKKTLIDVMLKLNSRYGENQSFSEEKFISEFVNEVHPDLQNFFSLYIEGKNQWNPNDQLNYVGIVYHDSFKESTILSPLNETDNDIKTKSLGMIGLERTILKTGPKEWAGLKEGDIINLNDYRNAFEPIGQKPKEGEIAKLKVKRNNEFITLDVVVKYGLKEKKNVLRAIEK